MRNSAITFALGLIVFAAAISSARADDSRWFSAAVGTGENVGVLRLGGLWRPACGCDWLARIGATPLLHAHVEYWNSRGYGLANDSAWNVGALGGARWLLSSASQWKPHIEFGVGGIATTHARIGSRQLATALLFDERLAAGVALDRAGKYEVAAYAEHRSNAGIRQPNHGLTTYGVELRVAWR